MRKLMLLLFALVLCAGAAFGEGRTVSGTVLYKKNWKSVPVIGAVVQVKGDYTVGTITDFDGKFTITLPEGADTLIVSSTGFETKEVKAKTKTKDGMKVFLKEDGVWID